MCRVFAVSGLSAINFPSKILLHPKGQLQRLLLTTFHHLLPQFALMLHTLLPFSESGAELIILSGSRAAKLDKSRCYWNLERGWCYHSPWCSKIRFPSRPTKRVWFLLLLKTKFEPPYTGQLATCSTISLTVNAILQTYKLQVTTWHCNLTISWQIMNLSLKHQWKIHIKPIHIYPQTPGTSCDSMCCWEICSKRNTLWSASVPNRQRRWHEMTGCEKRRSVRKLLVRWIIWHESLIISKRNQIKSSGFVVLTFHRLDTW